MPVIYITVFEEDLKWGNIVGWGCRCGCGVIIICFKIGLFNIVNVFDVFFSLFLFIGTYSVSLIWSFYFFFSDLFCFQYFLDFQWYPKGSCKMGLVCPSVLASVLHSRRFLEIVSLVISNFGMMLETQMKLCVTAGFSGKKLVATKFGEMKQKWAKTGLFEFIERFGH